MIGLEDRQSLSQDIGVVHAAGAMRYTACEIAGIDVRTLQRWKAHVGLMAGDGRPQALPSLVLAMLYWLGAKPSYSRPRVSDDNAYAESLFRTAQHRPEFPAKGFVDLEAARAWAAKCVRSYNEEHRHGGTRYVTPG